MTVPLPPLPPTGHDEVYRPGGRSMVELLAEEHDQIAALCAGLTGDTAGLGGDTAGLTGDTAGLGGDPTARRRSRVAEVLTATVVRHLSGEEQYLYPTIRAVLPGGGALADREIAADAELLRSLRDLVGAAPTESRFGQLADELAGQLRRHADAAATDIFPALRGVVGEADLIRLGNRVEIAEEAAPTWPHPDAPATPPWNRVVQPALGVLDKVRDAVTGRRTYPDDLARRPPSMI